MLSHDDKVEHNNTKHLQLKMKEIKYFINDTIYYIKKLLNIFFRKEQFS